MNDTSKEDAKVLDFAPRFKASDVPPPPSAPLVQTWSVTYTNPDNQPVTDLVAGYVINMIPLLIIASADAKTATPNDYVFILPTERLLTCVRS